jgi:ABC-type Zn uptake system ZnuABC Zn-binding protein ZnuA
LVYHTVEVINGGDVVGLQVGANPHVWYSARYVDAIRAAMLSKLEQLAPQAAAYFDAQSAALDQQFATYYSVINQIASQYGNVPVGATESIFVDMADTTGLKTSSDSLRPGPVIAGTFSAEALGDGDTAAIGWQAAAA